MNQSQKTPSVAIWQDYRRYRRNFLAIFELEQRLAADLYEAGERAANGAPTALDSAFLTEACRTLEDAAKEARVGLRGIAGSLLPDVKADSRALLAAVQDRFPDLDNATRCAAVEHLDRNGGPEGLLAALDAHLMARIGRYRAGIRAFRNARAIPGAGLDAAKAAVFPPRVDGVAPSVDAEARTGLVRAFTDATLGAEKAIRGGEAYPTALAEREVLAARLVARDPVAAVKLGISPGPYGEPEPLLCFIFGLGWAMCIVVFLLAASSHNVDEDEDDGDTTEG